MNQLPQLDEPLTSSISLSIPIYKRRERGYLLSLNDPLPARPQPEPFLRKNIIEQALEYHNYLKSDPARSYLHVSRNFGVTRARVAQLINLIERLPPRFIKKMSNCRDQKLIKAFSGKKLLKITGTKNPGQITSRINKLQEKLSP